MFILSSTSFCRIKTQRMVARLLAKSFLAAAAFAVVFEAAGFPGAGDVEVGGGLFG